MIVQSKKDPSSISRAWDNLELLENEILSLESQLPGNVKARLNSRLASLEARRRLLVDHLSSETGIIARMNLQEEIQSIHKDQISIRSEINCMDDTDPAVSLKIERANLKLKRMKTDYEKMTDDEVLFTGELAFRKP